MSNLRQGPSGGALKSGAETYSSAIADARNYMDWVVAQFRPFLHGKIMEVGIGHGNYCALLREYGDYVGVDVDSESVAAAQERFPDIRFAQCDILEISSLRRTLPSDADAIVSINVIEHIEDDRTAVSNLIQVLKPGGHLLLSVPALMMLYNEMDRLAGHFRRYTTASMQALLQGQPVEIVRLGYLNPIGGLGWWVNSLSKPKSLNAESINRQIRLFDRYIVPVSKALNPLFQSFFGQSVVCIARRK
jgi:SAM-dependent methyltransferase